MIIIFFILILFGLMFYFNINKGVLDEKQVEIAAERAVSLSLEALFLPELRCSKGDNIGVKGCIDMYKLERAMAEVEKNSDYYFDTFGYANITLVELYPGRRSECFGRGCVLYSRPMPNFKQRLRSQVPVALLNPINARQLPEYYFGVLTIETYS